MKYEIHFSVGEHDDLFIVSGKTTEAIREAAEQELKRRGLDADKNSCWSREAPHA